jgi:predicted DNA-binding helix-hairpin-helix protein
LAPEKNAGDIALSMARIRQRSDESHEENKAARKIRTIAGVKPQRKIARFAPAGQSTQMIVGADDSSDRSILTKSVSLYRDFRLRRVYYSAFSPIPHASAALPSRGAPLMREHRLYQADWLLRFYGFEERELVTDSGMLSLAVDPKMAWALAHPEHFPVDINRAAKETLLRVPGLGVQSVTRLLAARRVRRMRKADIERLGAPSQKVLAFVQLPDHRPGLDAAQRLLQPVKSAAQSPQQGDLFGSV